MTGFEPGASGLVSDRADNSDTAQVFTSLTRRENIEKRN